MRARLTALLIAIPLLVHAAPGDERWSATSKTAMAITGDIILSPSRLTMAKGVTLPLSVAADVPRFATDQGPAAVRILRVTQPANPVLLNGNRMCSTPARWVVVWRTPSRDLGMAVFSGEAQPEAEDTPGLCGTFFYARP